MQPWLPSWNYSCFQVLFRVIPHEPHSDRMALLLVHYPALCTCLFGATFCFLWLKDDERRAERRSYLCKAVVAFVFAVVITLVVRPYISWPAPARNPSFMTLFPRQLWGLGTRNSFPSHSTLAYFVVAAGFWPLRKDLSVVFSLATLMFVSLPRVYLGGHYPIDVFCSLVLGSLSLAAVWKWERLDVLSQRLLAQAQGTRIRKLLFCLWIVELADGFRGTEFLVGAVRHLLL